MSGVLNGVWTIGDADEGKRKEEEGKEMIVVRGFMPQTVHFKDLPAVEKTPQQIQQEEKIKKILLNIVLVLLFIKISTTSFMSSSINPSII